MILFRDVTDDQRIEDELREYVDRISEAERIVRFGVWKWEIASGARALVRRAAPYLRGRAGRIRGHRRCLHGAASPRRTASVSGPTSPARWRRSSRSPSRSGSCAPTAAERILLSQGRVIAGPDGSAQALVGVCHDVTDRAEVEQALGASERRMRAIIDNTPSLISVKDLDGRYLMSNAESERVLGTPAADLVGLRCVDIFPPEIAESQRANDLRAASEGEPVYGEAVLIRDGEPRTFVTVTFPLPDDEGFPAETCTIATDVTERKERDSERRERLEWQRRIASALAENRMLAFTQPIVDLRTGEHSARELLVRMRTPDRAQVVEPGRSCPPPSASA